MCVERNMEARSGVRILIRPPGCTLLIVTNLRTCFKEGAMLQLIYTPVTHLLLYWAKNIRKLVTVHGGKKALLFVDVAAGQLVVTVSKRKVIPLEARCGPEG